MSDSRTEMAAGTTVFAGIMMIIIGVLHAIQGFVALFNNTIYVVGDEWVLSVDVTVWGYIQLLLGLLVAFAGYFLFKGAVWARTVGVIVAGVSLVATFAWLPYYPLWAILIIAVDVLVIWALTFGGRAAADGMRSRGYE